MTIHHSDNMIAMNKQMIDIDVFEIAKYETLLRFEAIEGMQVYYREVLLVLARSLRISRENLIRWEAL